ncbi:hypothetical protein EJ03DRAFT_379700 [Teratosphaeria nubilosa]|uniref:Uncharacterized protein n=1 Tax=Teratosphaeria nubilosa TaxID=161662 RepID=A0A6G1LLR1_9PEZI|nr:hypothetical protein EJ03DRAFT_379700 [Teratosphaeria nubilosa]
MKTMLNRSTWRSIIRLRSAHLGLQKPPLFKVFHSAPLSRQLSGDLRSEVQGTPSGPFKHDLCHQCWSWLPAGQIAAHVATHHSGMQLQKPADTTSASREMDSRAVDPEEEATTKPSKAMCQHCGRFVPSNEMNQHLKECHDLQRLDSHDVDSRSATSRSWNNSKKQDSSESERTEPNRARQLSEADQQPDEILPASSGDPAPAEDGQDIFQIASSLVMCPKCDKFMPLAELDFHVQNVHEHPTGDRPLPRKRSWTAEDNARLEGLFSEGFSDQQIGRLLQRTPSSITMKRRRKVIGARNSQGAKEERDRIDEMIKNGQSDAEIAKVMGRPPSWIKKLRQSTRRVEPWTEQDVKELNALLEQGLGDSEIAERIGRTKQSVNAKRQKLGIIRLSEDGKWFGGIFRRENNAPTTENSALPQELRSWTPEEVKKLQEMVSQGLGDQHIADRLGRTRSSVSGFRRRKLEPPGNKHLDRLFHGTRPSAWSSEEIEVLRSLTEQGLGDLEIARKLGRNRLGVASAKRNHLIRTAEGVRVKEKIKFKPRYWSNADLASLKELVLQGVSDLDIAAKLDRPETSVQLQRRKLGLRRRTPIWHVGSAAGDPEATHIKPVLRAQPIERDVKEESSSDVNASSEIASANEAPEAERMTLADSDRNDQDSQTTCASERNYPDCRYPSHQTAPDDADGPRPWTGPELARLEQLCSSDLTSQKIASELGRPLRDVLAAREKYGFEVKHGTAKPRLKWSAVRLSEVKSLLASGMPETEVASRLGLSMTALRQLRKRKGIPYVKGEKRETRTWQPAEIEQVKKLKSEGKTVKEIAESMSRTQSGVWMILARIRMQGGKSAGRTSSSPRSYRAWTEKDITTLRHLYFSKELPPDVIAGKMGRSEVSIKAFLTKYREKLMREDFAQLLSEIVRPGFWTEEEIDRMCGLMGEGKSVKEIAEEMGRSKVAVKYRRWIVMGGGQGER